MSDFLFINEKENAIQLAVHEVERWKKRVRKRGNRENYAGLREAKRKLKCLINTPS